MKYKTIYDTETKGKTVFLRVDLNSPVVAGRVIIGARIREHAKTLYYFSEEGARTVAFSHQGRPNEPEFIPLKRHAVKLSKLLGREVKFRSWDENYLGAIKKLSNGEILLLDNTRFQKEEMVNASPAQHAKDGFIAALAPLGGLFVQDALSICHRSHATVVGFSRHMPSYAGCYLLKELEALEKLENVDGKRLLVLGGAKPEDSLKVLAEMLERGRADEAIIGGLFGELFLWANGTNFGEKEKFFEEKGYAKLKPELKKTLNRFRNKISLPKDFAVSGKGGKREEIPLSQLPSKHSTFDIGKQTIEEFKKKIRKSNLVICNGPMGKYEKKEFSIGTQKILEAAAFSRAFSIVGGGDTEKAISALGMLTQDFNFVSLAGKALLAYLAGEKLPGLGVLAHKD